MAERMLRTGGARASDWAGRSAALACALAIAMVGCGGGADGDGTESEPPAREPSAERPTAEPAPPSGALTEPAEPGPPESAEEDEAVEAALSYLAAIDSRDAGRACGLLAPGRMIGRPGPTISGVARLSFGGAAKATGAHAEKAMPTSARESATPNLWIRRSISGIRLPRQLAKARGRVLNYLPWKLRGVPRRGEADA